MMGCAAFLQDGPGCGSIWELIMRGILGVDVIVYTGFLCYFLLGGDPVLRQVLLSKSMPGPVTIGFACGPIETFTIVIGNLGAPDGRGWACTFVGYGIAHCIALMA